MLLRMAMYLLMQYCSIYIDGFAGRNIFVKTITVLYFRDVTCSAFIETF